MPRYDPATGPVAATRAVTAATTGGRPEGGGRERPATFEQRLESMISGAFARAFRSAVQPVEIAAALQRECDNNAQILIPRAAAGAQRLPRRAVAQPTSTGSRRTTARWPSDLIEQLQEHADAAGLRLPRARSRSRSRRADDLTTGRFRIRSRAQAQVTEQRHRTPQVRRARAVLEVNGTRHPLAAARPGRRPGHRGRPAHQRPGREPAAHRVRASTRGRRRTSRSATSAPPTACSSTATAGRRPRPRLHDGTDGADREHRR